MNYRYFFFSLVLIGFMAFSCSKSDEPTPTADISGHYEFKLKGQTTNAPDKYYYMTFTHQGTTVTGDVAVIDSGDMVEGVVTGTVVDGNFNLTFDLGGAEHSFVFSGSLAPGSQSPSSITGTISHNQTKSSADTTMLGTIFNITDWHCQDTVKPNAYVFRKVWSAPNPGGPPVILVHGMTGAMTNWDTVMLNLSASFKAKHDVWEFQYNWKDSIHINGRALRDSVNLHGLVDPILVAHSMGGLVSRAYVVNGGTITKLVTIGTPNLGTPLVDLIGIVCSVNFPGPRNMLPQGAFIQGLLHHPLDIANRSKYYMIAGQMKGDFQVKNGIPAWTWQENYYATTDKIGFALMESLFKGITNDGLVPVSSALFEGGSVNNPLPVQEWVDHLHLIHPGRDAGVMDFINSL